MYRAYAYLTIPDVLDGYRLTSIIVKTLVEADDMLIRLLAIEGVTGGGLEWKVPNIGWTIVD